MKLNEMKNKKIVILGFGVEGKSIYNFLKTKFPEQQIDTIEKITPETQKQQKNYDLAIKSPGIHGSQVHIPYTTATNIFFGNVLGVTIGVTGSKGKSTTSSLIYAFLLQAGKKVHLVGNITHKLDPIGSPMLTELLQSNTAEDIWICELSSFQLSDITYSPHISVITSFFPEHMDYHGSLENYWNAKKNIIANAQTTDYLVYNSKFLELKQFAKEAHVQTVPFQSEVDNSFSVLPLQGSHNLDNINGAITVAKLLGVNNKTIQDALFKFKPLPHRLENVGTFRSITFYDDAISTTPESAIQAIKTLKNIGTIFLGGQDRGFDFSNLAKIVAQSSIINLVLFPESGSKIYHELTKITKKKYQVLQTSDMHEAVLFAYRHTPKDYICLLSTASPSYSVWNNFEEKGNLFKKLVRELSEQI